MIFRVAHFFETQFCSVLTLRYPDADRRLLQTKVEKNKIVFRFLSCFKIVLSSKISVLSGLIDLCEIFSKSEFK